MKNFIPQSLKLSLRIALRNIDDFKSRDNRRFVQKKNRAVSNWPCRIKIDQQPPEGIFYHGKIANMRLATKSIAKVLVKPGELFSFWKLIGKATKNNGFQKGRNLIAGELKESYGGGICQLSGILYHTALLAGLPIVERYSHTRDIYKDHERYTPLGADATVVYGYKDLRFVNPFETAIYFDFEIRPDFICCQLHCRKPVSPRKIKFQQKMENGKKIVLTNEIEPDGKLKLLGKSVYLEGVGV